MMKRNLKADLEWLKGERLSLERDLSLIKNNPFYTKERKEMQKLLTTYNAIEIVTKQALYEEERAIEAEALVQELVELLKEADNLIGLASYLISDGSVYSEDYGEFLTRCDTLDFRMKEVLGDE